MRFMFCLFCIFFINSFSFCQKINSQIFQKAEFNQNGIIFSIDPRIELWNTIAITLGYPDANPAKLKYKDDIQKKFSKYATHKALQNLFATLQKGWDLSTPFHFFLHFDDQLNFSSKNLSKDIIERSGGLDSTLRLAKEIRDFAIESKYYDFFNQHQNFYNLILQNTAFNFRDFDERKRIEDFYGEKNDKYTIVLNMLESTGNFGVRVKTSNAEKLYALISCNTANGDVPAFAPDFQFYNLVYHEFSHSFCNPMVYAMGDKINEFNNLLDPIKESMQQQGYDNWLTVVHEHLVRASSIVLAENKFGFSIAQEKFYKNEMGRRFIYTKALVEKLRYYQRNRNIYKSYKDFFPELIKVFSSHTSTEIALLQNEVEKLRLPDIDKIPIPSAASWDSSMVFVIPTNEKTDSLNALVKSFANQMKDMINPKIQIITDIAADSMLLSEKDILAFGTTTGNRLIAKYIKSIPIIIEDTYVVFKNLHKGTDYQIVLSWLNPFNPKRKFIMYTGQQAEDIKNYFYSPYKDGNNYWIARNCVTVAKGNFERFMKVWTAN